MVSDAKPAALPDDGTLPSPQGPGLLSPSDWRVLPTWFHLATGTYFVTNSIMVWTMSQIAPSPLAAGLGIGGLFVGFVEHISPYFPNIYVSVNTERIVGRLPTIVAFLMVFRSLNFKPAVIAAQCLGFASFMMQPTLSTMKFSFHLEHVVVEHFGGTLALLAALGIKNGKLPWLSNLVTSK